MKSTTYIKNAQIVHENGIIWDGALIYEDGIIKAFGAERDLEAPAGCELIDAGGAYAGPGFVDIHVHGGAGFDTCLQAEKAAEHFLSHGETTILATPSYELNFKELMDAIDCAKEGIKGNETIKGLYLEGPYTSPDYGANAINNPWRKEIPPEEFTAFVDNAGLFAKVWAIAPERPDLLPFLEYARKVNPDCIFALAHSEATPMEVRALGKYRPTIQTHSMNATGRRKVYGGTRAYGPDEYSFKEIDVYCELISDSCGIHVHPEMQQLLLHNKGIERTILITDSTTDIGENPPQYAHVTDLNFDVYGGISGSKMTMDKACKNVMSSTNCGIAQAFYMAATTPARAIGMDNEIGSIYPGKKADIIFTDDKFSVKRVIQSGKIKY